jgi:hypothetical protein
MGEREHRLFVPGDDGGGRPVERGDVDATLEPRQKRPDLLFGGL